MTSASAVRTPYSIYLPIQKAYDGADGKTWVFEAPLSEPGKDLQKERMNVSGLRKGLEVFRRLDMPVDWDHLWERTREPRWLIGKGMELYDAPHPRTGEGVPWVRGVLYKSKEIARQAKEHWDACQETGSGGLGISVAGQVLARDPLDKSHILEPIVTSIALTPVPVVDANNGTVQFLKALRRAATLVGQEGPEILKSITFPCTPELYRSLVPAWAAYADPAEDLADQMRAMRKAMEATGAVPRSGPGGNALELESLAGGSSRRERGTDDDADDDADDEDEDDPNGGTVRPVDRQADDEDRGQGGARLHRTDRRPGSGGAPMKKAYDQELARRVRLLLPALPAEYRGAHSPRP